MTKVKIVIEFTDAANEELTADDAKEIVESALEHEEITNEYTVTIGE